MWGRDLKGGALKVESSPTFTESCPHSKRVDCFPTFKEGQDPQMSGFVKTRGFGDAVTCTGEQEGGGSDHVPGYYFRFSMLYHKEESHCGTIQWAKESQGVFDNQSSIS